jgi:hypothetical protein
VWRIGSRFGYHISYTLALIILVTKTACLLNKLSFKIHCQRKLLTASLEDVTLRCPSHFSRIKHFGIVRFLQVVGYKGLFSGESLNDSVCLCEWGRQAPQPEGAHGMEVVCW